MMAAEVENDCPICQETLHGPFSVGCTVPCGHLFHKRCFETWQIHSKAKRCPCCNSDLRGFIDKIHITLPTSNSNAMDDPELKLARRKALSNEKAKRSAMMRHKDRRRKAETRMDHLRDRDEVEPKRDCAAASRAISISLSASLQRIPSDPGKGAELLRNELRDLSEEDTQKIDMGMNSLYIYDGLFADVEHLEDQIPDVADKIMRNIERTIRQPRSSSHLSPEKHQIKTAPSSIAVKKK